GAWPAPLGSLALLAVGSLTAAGVVLALAPPAAYDDLTYHLAAPKVYLRTGAVRILPYDHHTAFPFTLEMLYTLALLVGNAATAKLLHAACWLLSLLAIFVLGRDHLGPRTGWLATLIFATTPLAFSEVGTAYNEFGYSLYQLLAWLCLFDYLNLRSHAVRFAADGSAAPKARQAAWLPLCGVFAGLIYGTKYTGALSIAFLLAAVVVLGRRDGLRRQAIRADSLAFLLIAGLVASPWVLRTWLGTGNPVFPFAHGLFQSPYWSDERAGAYQGAQQEFGRSFVYTPEGLQVTEPSAGSHRRLGRLLAAPWHLTFSPDWFFDRGLNFDGKARLGPAYLAGGLAAIVFWLLLLWRYRHQRSLASYQEQRDEQTRLVYKQEFGREVPVPTTRAITERVTVDTRRVQGLLLAHVLFFGLVWFVTMQYSRYLLPHLALWALLAAAGADGMLRLPLAGAAASVVLAMQVIGGLAFALTASFPALRVQLGGLTAEQYAAAPLPAWRAMAWINANTPPEAKVILYGEPRGYWLDRAYLWGERGHHTLIPDSARQSMAAYLAYLKEQLGVTHALVYEAVFPTDRATGGDDIALVTQAIRQGRLREVYRDERRPVVVYELR
ncbi:MAG: hypothetical protein HUU35_04605, partial [Armatimonadetes bacterium]|nr:hypothetical protein [Armatimonadota bacterium]